jgi:hypothetical protein
MLSANTTSSQTRTLFIVAGFKALAAITFLGLSLVATTQNPEPQRGDFVTFVRIPQIGPHASKLSLTATPRKL